MSKYAFFFIIATLIFTGEIFKAPGYSSGKIESSKIMTNRQNTVEEAVTLETPTGALYGTLLVPESKAPLPVVLIIAGSGPTDRNGNSSLRAGANNSLKMLAEGLAANGIASLRYDKRGIGASAKAIGKEEDLRFDNYIDDAALWSKQLRADKRFSTLTIAGHSEGSLIGMAAALREKADGYVSIAGPSRRIDKTILDQIRPQLPPELFKTSEDIFAQLAAGKIPESTPPVLNSIFRPSVLPYMISWIKYDPAVEIAKLPMPVLIVQGTTDMQVKVEDAKLLAGSKPAARLVLIEGMNHVFKTVPDDVAQQNKSYGDPALPVAPQLVSEISKFVMQVKVSKP